MSMSRVDRRPQWTAMVLALALSLVGCAAAPPPNAASLFVRTDFHAPLNTPLVAQTGDAVFVEGMFIHQEVMTLSQDFSTTLPGSFRIPFPVSIRKGQLRMTRVEGEWKYFCAKEGAASASFPGIGSVIASGDCVGVRQSYLDGRLEWVVDNSIHNHATTIWTRSVVEKERPLLTRAITDNPFSARTLKRIVFDGFYGEQFHFTFDDTEIGSPKQSKSFVFDRNPAGTTVVGIHGEVFRITAADNVQITYEWVKL